VEGARHTVGVGEFRIEQEEDSAFGVLAKCRFFLARGFDERTENIVGRGTTGRVNPRPVERLIRGEGGVAEVLKSIRKGVKERRVVYVGRMPRKIKRKAVIHNVVKIKKQAGCNTPLNMPCTDNSLTVPKAPERIFKS